MIHTYPAAATSDDSSDDDPDDYRLCSFMTTDHPAEETDAQYGGARLYSGSTIVSHTRHDGSSVTLPGALLERCSQRSLIGLADQLDRDLPSGGLVNVDKTTAAGVTLLLPQEYRAIALYQPGPTLPPHPSADTLRQIRVWMAEAAARDRMMASPARADANSSVGGPPTDVGTGTATPYFHGCLAVRDRKVSPFSYDMLLLDNQSSVSMVMSPSLVDDIQPIPPRTITGIAGTAGGELTADQDGTLPGLPGLRFLIVPGASANILAYCDVVTAGWPVQIRGVDFVVITPVGEVRFATLPGQRAHPATSLPVAPASVFVTTSATTIAQRHYSTAQVKAADAANKLLHNLGLPCDQYLINGLPTIQSY